MRPKSFRSFLNDKNKFARYAWPGGYEIFYITHDGGLLCADCATEHIYLMEDGYSDWTVEGCIHASETDSELRCEHCGYFTNDPPDPEIPEDGEDYYNNMWEMRSGL